MSEVADPGSSEVDTNSTQPKEKRSNALCTLVIFLFLLGAFAGAILLAAHYKGGGVSNFFGNKDQCASSCSEGKCPSLPVSETTPLPMPESLDRGVSPWFIASDIAQQPVSLEMINGTSCLRVDYRVGLYSSDSGASFQFNPFDILPSKDSFTLSYQMYLPADFPWAKGGKLPGVCIGDTDRGCATGGQWANSSGSFRPVWSEGGRVIGYLYLPLQAGKSGPEFLKISKATAETGVKLWCHADGGLKLVRAAWNNITVHVAMGTPGLADGSITLWVNGKTRSVSDVAWRISPEVGISRAIFANFFGGGDASWKVPYATFGLFTNFSFAAGSPSPIIR